MKQLRLLKVVICLGCLLGVLPMSMAATATADRLQIVTTIFPEYDWVQAIMGDLAQSADIVLLLDQGVDLHSYQPTAKDLVKIANCDLFIHVGGESDTWVPDALKSAHRNVNRHVINLMETLKTSIKEEELVEGMEPEQEEAEAEAEEGPEYDEHVWLSLRRSAKVCAALATALETLDPAHAEEYAANAKRYIGELMTLDKAYQAAVAAGRVKTLLFGDRFPFRYMAEDYGLTYFAAFKGCSAETEASFKTIRFLAKKVDELNLKSVLTIEGAQHKIAQAVVRSTKTQNQQILTMNSLQSITQKNLQAGVTYLSIMQQNLKTLQEALK